MSTSRTGLELRVDSYQFFNIVHLIRAVTDSIMRSKLYFYDLVQGIVMENFLVHHVPNSFGFKEGQAKCDAPKLIPSVCNSGLSSGRVSR